MPASSSSRSPTFWVFPVAQLLPLLWQIMSAVWSWGSSCELNHCGVLRNRMYCRQISSSVIPFGHRRVTVDDMSMMCAAGLHWFILCSTTEGWSAKLVLISTVTGTDTLKPFSSCELQVSDDCLGLQFRSSYHFDSLTTSLDPVMRGVFWL